MANPRKFADKLEIIRRKEEEANAAYVQIMRECAELSDARKASPVHAPNMHLPSHHNQQSWIGRSPNEYMKLRQIWKGGSLPNVHSSPNNSVNSVNVNPQQLLDHEDSIRFRGYTIPDCQKNSYNALNDGFQQQQQSYGGIRHGRSMDPPSGPIFPSRNKYPHRYIVTQPYKNNLLQQPSLLEEQNESPGWRIPRAVSDSAIQHTLGEPPKPNNINGSGPTLQQQTPASRIIQSPNQQSSHTDLHNLHSRSPPVSIRYSDTNRNNIKMQADTSSLPDLSNLSIPSPIQNPIDMEQEGKANAKSRDPQNHFQAPYTIPSRRGKQMYARQASASDILETMHREQKPNLNLFPDISACSSNATVSNASHSVSAPLSPVTPPPFFWSTTPISPLATTDILTQQSPAPAPPDLQQQLFQIHNDGVRDNGTSNPPPYNYQTDDDTYNSSFCSNNFLNNKQSIYRMNSGPANLSSNSKSICDHQLESALMRVKAQQGVNDLDSALLRVKASHHQEHELSPADLNSVRVALHPLDFDDVQMLSDNVQLVDQSAEEQFRLERASYQ